MRGACAASIAALTTLLAGSVNAMPTPAPYHSDSAITLAAGGCGPAFHRSVYGGCVPNGYGWGGGVVVAPGFYGGGYRGGYYHGGGAYYHGGRLLSRRRLARWVSRVPWRCLPQVMVHGLKPKAAIQNAAEAQPLADTIRSMLNSGGDEP